jgi:hypothetical protein
VVFVVVAVCRDKICVTAFIVEMMTMIVQFGSVQSLLDAVQVWLTG